MWSLQVFIFGLLAITFPYREGKQSKSFLATRLYVLGIGLPPIERWKILIAVCFLWLGPYGVALIASDI